MNWKKPTRYNYILSTRETLDSETNSLKVKEWKKIFHAKSSQRRAGVGILLSDEIGIRTKTVTRDKDGHVIMVKS